MYRINTYGGVGDQLTALPVAYAIKESLGEDVAIGRELHCNPTINPDMTQFNTMPFASFGNEFGDTVVDITECLQWNGKETILDMTLDRMGLSHKTTPRIAMLLDEPTCALIPDNKKYVVIAAQGVSSAKAKQMNLAQINAVTYAAHRLGCATVAVGHNEGSELQVDYDLRGQTTIKELAQLVCNAELVVATDTGVLHLAGAYSIPFIGLYPERHIGMQLEEYAPKYILSGLNTFNVDEKLVADKVLKLLSLLRNKWCVVGPDMLSCGVAETGRVTANAAGVPYRTYAEHDGGWCVAEYHEAYINEFSKSVNSSKTVISAHKMDHILLSSYAGVLFRNKAYYNSYAKYARGAYYVPLHTDFISEMPAKFTGGAMHFMIHGQARFDKGMDEIIDAWQIANEQNENVLFDFICSMPTTISGNNCMGYLRSKQLAGCTIKEKEYWTHDELAAELNSADVLVYFDPINKEQSGAGPAILGLGKPVIVSTSSAFDDIRAWCYTSTKAKLPETMLAFANDADLYNEYAKRAWLGSQFRKPELIARQYKAAVIQAMIDKEM